MAISISKYIDVKSKLIQGTVGTRDFSGLVFTTSSMEDSVPTEFSSVKTDYDAGKPVALTSDGIASCFSSSSDIAVFAAMYFGYNGGNHTPVVLNVAKVLTTSGTQETAKTAYDRVAGQFSNYGALTFLGSFTLGESGDGGLLDVASANDSTDHEMVVVVGSSQESATKTALASFTMVQVVVATVASGTNYAAWMTLAWYASVDYSKTDASSTMDYKQFAGQDYEVDTDSTKTTYDTDNVNYVGLVQVNGSDLKFFQTGVNMDGTDTGVVRDKVWMNGEIAAGWFNLTTSVQKVPANYVGAAMVKAMIVSVATAAINNGAILVDKELTDTQKATIRSYTNNDASVEAVQSTGYYIAVKVSLPTGSTQYVCEYILIYAKGDHIGKVSGTNYLT